MFAVVITEKGGAQRRVEFDKTEVTIGRVQGNDIILPKGNVSKRHSRIVLRDNRFIVVDLKSTNGTYVNGRKITSPLSVKPGDKVYIGDFILTVEGLGEYANAGMSQSPPAPTDGMDDLEGTPVPSLPPSSIQGAPPSMQGAPPSMQGAPPPLPSSPGAPAFAPVRPPVQPPVMPPLAQPAPVAPAAVPSFAAPPSRHDSHPPRAASIPPARATAVTGGEPLTRPPGAKRELEPAPIPREPAPIPREPAPVHREPAPVSREPAPIPREAGAGRLLDQVLDQTGLHAELAAGFLGEAHAAALDKASRQLGGDDRSTRELVRELVGFGPLEGLLADRKVRRIVAAGTAAILVDRGMGIAPDNAAFSDVRTMAAVARRLLATGGATVKDGMARVALADGGFATIALSPSAVQGPIIDVRRRPPTLDELIARSGTAPETAAAVARAFSNKERILMVGPTLSVADWFGALLGGTTSRAAVVSGAIATTTQHIALAYSPSEVLERVAFAAALPTDALVVHGASIHDVGGVLRTGEGHVGAKLISASLLARSTPEVLRELAHESATIARTVDVIVLVDPEGMIFDVLGPVTAAGHGLTAPSLLGRGQ